MYTSKSLGRSLTTFATPMPAGSRPLAHAEPDLLSVDASPPGDLVELGGTIMKRVHVPAIVLSLVLFACCSVNAGVIAHDDFDYGPVGSDLLGQIDPLDGFTSAWQEASATALHTNYDIAAGSLSFGGLATSGNRVVAASSSLNIFPGVARDLSIPGTPGTTVFVSFLLRPEGVLNEGLYDGYFGLTLEAQKRQALRG